jgi:hypothetical protein
MKYKERNHTHLWNDLSWEERHQLMPYMLESQILHIQQTMQKAIEAHNKFLQSCNDQINNINNSLERYNK